MTLTRILFTMAIAFAGLVLTVGTASAQLEVHNEPSSEGECGDVTLDRAHVVEGGCRIEFKSEENVPLIAYIPTPIEISNCEVHIEGQVDEGGAGYITNAVLTAPMQPSQAPCTREPCDEAGSGEPVLPWPFTIGEGSGVAEMTLGLCLRSASSAEGTAGTICVLDVSISDNGNHAYEVGGGGETRCEGFPTPPLALNSAHFVNENEPPNTDDDVEIIH